MVSQVKRLADLVKGTASVAGSAIQVEIKRIEPDEGQPRRSFRADSLNEMAETIRAHGVIQPLVVRPSDEILGNYKLVAGERRLQAAELAGLTEVPVIVRDLDLKTVRLIQLVENIQREDLDPVEEAIAVKSLVDTQGAQTDVASLLGKTKSWVSLRCKLAANAEVVADFRKDGRTKDVVLLCMLVDLHIANPDAFAEFLSGRKQESLTRAAVRLALDDAAKVESGDPGTGACPCAEAPGLQDIGRGSVAPGEDSNEQLEPAQLGGPRGGGPSQHPMREGGSRRERGGERVSTSVVEPEKTSVVSRAKRVLESVFHMDAEVVTPVDGAPGHVRMSFGDDAQLDAMIDLIESLLELRSR